MTIIFLLMLALGLQSELGHVSFIHYEKNVRPYSHFVTGKKDMDILEKRGITLKPFGRPACHVHLHVIVNMCIKFHSDDLKAVGGV